ncbi:MULTISPECIES: amidase family protein [Nocardiopsidaceae]|uniref:Amidase family protein n=1 Tax=Streptomonospora nanhaiensis TaxID=1323731 RepID=A0ABY6YWA5_9ACTN|nr:amidase family protein [Streptomonospora nanhaiensis]WAE76585.1 amidase family protein [Streptomonospora nanhaiensis]
MGSAWARLLETVDVVVAPTVPITAVPVGQELLHWPDGSVETVSDAHVRLCAPANLTVLPALTVPTRPGSGGLPSGLQLIGRPLGRQSSCASAPPTSPRAAVSAPWRRSDVIGLITRPVATHII